MVLVTGGAGYIGSHTIKELASYNIETIVIDNLSTGHREFVKWSNFYHGDILNTQLLDRIFQEHRIELVLHFAALASVGESVNSPNRYYINNGIGTLNILNAMLKHNVKNIIFSSTCSIYGNPTNIPISETEKPMPINPYGWTKFFMERAIKDYSKAFGFNYIILRYFNAAGSSPDLDIGEDHIPETHLIPKILMYLHGFSNEFTIFGNDYETKDGTCVRDYIHVMDLAIAHRVATEKLLSIKNRRYRDEFNLGSGIGYSVKEVLETVKRLTHKDRPVKYGQRRAGDPAILVADPKKIKNTLNFSTKYSSIDNIIETAVAWFCKRFNC